MLSNVLNGLIRTFGREVLEEWVPLDHVCVTSVKNPEIHVADIAIPEAVFQTYSAPFALVSSNIRRIVVKCDWAALFRSKKGKIRIDVDGVDLVVRTKRLEELDPERAKNSALRRKKRNLEKWLKYSVLGINSDKAAKFVNRLSIRAKNIKITFVDDVIYKDPFAVIIKADLVTGGGTDSKSPNLNDLERKGLLKSLLSHLLFKSKGVQIEYRTYETPDHESDYAAGAGADQEYESEYDGLEEAELESTSSHFSDELFESDFSEQEEEDRRELKEFLQVKRSRFCMICSCGESRRQIAKTKVKPSERKYLNILNTPHKRFKLTTAAGIHVGISVKIWNFNALFFVDRIACEPMQKIKLFLCGNDPEYTNQEHYGYLFDGSVRYSQLKLNFSSEFVHTLHDFIRYVRILSAFKAGATAGLYKTPSVQSGVRYYKLLRRSGLFSPPKDDQEFMDAFEERTSLGILIRLRNMAAKRRNRPRVVFAERAGDTSFRGPKRPPARRHEDPEEDLGIKIEQLFEEEDEVNDEYDTQFAKNFEGFHADEYAANFFNKRHQDEATGNQAGRRDGDSSNRDDWFLGPMSFGIVAPNLRVDLVPTSRMYANAGGSRQADKRQTTKQMLDCVVAQLSCFDFNIVQIAERRSSIKIFLSRPICRYGRVECYMKKYSFSCDLVLGDVLGEKVVAAPTAMFDDHLAFFDGFGAEDVSKFVTNDFEEIKRQSLIAIGIENYPNSVKKNLVNTCPLLVVANSALEMYLAVEPNLLNRAVNHLLTFELFLHRTFATGGVKIPDFSKCPLKNTAGNSADQLGAIDRFLERNLDDALLAVVHLIRQRLLMKTRNLVDFTGMEMKMLCFFTDSEKRKRTRADAKRMYEVNEQAISSWPYQKSIGFHDAKRHQSLNDEADNTGTGTVSGGDEGVVVSIDGNGQGLGLGPDSERYHGWLYNARACGFSVDSLDLGPAECLEASLDGMNVLVDTFTTSRKVTLHQIDVALTSGHSSFDRTDEPTNSRDSKPLLRVDFLSLHMVMGTKSFLVRLEGVDLYSTLLRLAPVLNCAVPAVETGLNLKTVVECIRTITCFPSSSSYTPLKPDFTDFDFLNFDPENVKKTAELENAVFNLVGCYCAAVYEADLRLLGDQEQKLLLSVANFRIFLLRAATLLYSLVLYKFNLELARGTRERMKLNLKGANLLNHVYSETAELHNLSSRYDEEHIEDITTGHDEGYEVLLACNANDLKNNKITTKRVQYGQVLAQVERDDNLLVKVELRSLNVKYSEPFVNHLWETCTQFVNEYAGILASLQRALPKKPETKVALTRSVSFDTPDEPSDKFENLKLYVSSINSCVYVEGLGATLDLFCNLTKKGASLAMEVTRLSLGLLWANYRRFLTLSLIDMSLMVHDYRLFVANRIQSQGTAGPNQTIANHDGGNGRGVTLSLAQVYLWYHVNDCSQPNAGVAAESHGSSLLSSMLTLFNEYWFSHTTWCLLPTCPDEDLLVPIFATKLSSYSRLRPILNKTWVRHYVKLMKSYDPLYSSDTAGPEANDDEIADEFLNTINVVEKDDCPQVSCDLTATKHDAIVLTRGTFRVGDFVLNLDANMIKQLTKYSADLKSVSESVKNSLAAKFGGRGHAQTQGIKQSVILSVDFNLNGDVIHLLGDYATNVSCMCLPEVPNRYKKLRFRLLQAYLQDKVVLSVGYGGRVVLQHEVGEHALFRLTRELEANSGGTSSGEPKNLNLLKILNEQAATFAGNLVVSAPNCNLFVDAYVNYNLLKDDDGGEPRAKSEAVKLVKKFQSIQLEGDADEKPQDHELVKILNLGVYDKKVDFAKNEEEMLLNLVVDRIQALDHFGKYLLDNVYETRLKASEIYDVPEEVLPKERNQVMLSFSRKGDAKKLNVAISNTLTEVQPDFVNMLLTIAQTYLARRPQLSDSPGDAVAPAARGETRNPLRFNLYLNMYEVWLYPCLDFYTRSTQDLTPENNDYKPKVMPRIIKTAQKSEAGALNSPNSGPQSPQSVPSRIGHERSYYDDRMHILCLLVSGSVSNTSQYNRSNIKYLALSMGSVLLLENNLKVLVDQNDGLIVSKVNDACNRFLLELRNLATKYKIDAESILLSSEVDSVKLCNSAEDMVKLLYMKDYYYPTNLSAILEKETAENEPESPQIKVEEEQYRSLDDIFRSFGLDNIQGTARPDLGVGTEDKTKNIKNMFKALDRLYCSGNRQISVNVAVGTLQAILFTAPNSLVVGLNVHSVDFEFIHSAEVDDDYATFTLALMFDVALLNNKFAPTDFLLQTTPLKLELVSNREEEDRDTVLVLRAELGAATVDFNNNMNRLLRYFVGVLKRIKQIERSVEVGRITVYNELEHEVCLFSGNVKRELDYFLVPNNTSVELFSKEFTLLISNENNAFTKCDNLLGYMDNNLLFGNTNNVVDFVRVHNVTGPNALAQGGGANATANKGATRPNGPRNAGPLNSRVIRANYIYLGKFEGNENILKLPTVGDVVLVEQMHDKVIITTNIKIENLTDISLYIGRYRRHRDPTKPKRPRVTFALNRWDEGGDGLVVEKYTSVGVPVAWFRERHLPFITYHNRPGRGDNALFTVLRNLLAHRKVATAEDKKGDENLLRFKNGLCFRTTVTSYTVNDINETECVKHVITIEPIFKITNKLPFNAVVFYSMVKNNTKVNFRNINFDLLLYDKVDSLSLVDNSGAIKELRPNQTWNIPVYSNKFYLKILIKGTSLVNSDKAAQTGAASTRRDDRHPHETEFERNQVERYSLIEYLKRFNNINQISENNLVFTSDLFEINLPHTGNLVTSKGLSYLSGPIEETTLRHLEPLLSQLPNHKAREEYHRRLKRNHVNIRLNRHKLSFFWPYIFENFTKHFLCLNGNLVPPNFKLFTTTGEANNSRLRAFVRNDRGEFVPTREVVKLDYTSTTANRPPINLMLESPRPSETLKKAADAKPALPEVPEELETSREESERYESSESLNSKSTREKSEPHMERRRTEAKPSPPSAPNDAKSSGCLSLGCSVRSLTVSAYPTRIVVFHSYYTFINRMPYNLILKAPNSPRVLIRANEQAEVNTTVSHLKLVVLNRGANPERRDAEDARQNVNACMVSLNPQKIPLNLQIRPRKYDFVKYNQNALVFGQSLGVEGAASDLILDLHVVEGKFDFGLPCKFNGLYYIVSLATTTTYQLLNLTSHTLYVVDPNYISGDREVAAKGKTRGKSSKSKPKPKPALKENAEATNLTVLRSLKLAPHVLHRNEDRRVAFKADLAAEWQIYNIDTLKNIQTFKVSYPGAESARAEREARGAQPSLYLSCIMKRDGTRVICFVDDYVLLCRLLQRVEQLHMNRITSVWSKIVFTLTTPRITTTMSSKKKLVLAAHLNNLSFSVILNNANVPGQAASKLSASNSKFSISCTRDWILDVSLNIRGCHVDHFVQGFIPVIMKALTNRHSVLESFLVFKLTCTVFSNTIQTFDNVYFKLSPISMNVEMRVIEQIVDYFEMLASESRGPDGAREGAAGEAVLRPVTCCVDDSARTASMVKKYFKRLTIEPVTVVLAIRTSDVKLSRQSLQLLDALPLDTPSVCVQFFAERVVQSVCTFEELGRMLKNSYLKQLIRQSLPSAWLSNSLAVVYGVIKGFLYLFTQPFSCCKKFKNGVEGFMLGINNGIKFWLLFVVGGFAQSVGHLLNVFYKIVGRGRAKPIGILDALWLGANSLVLDVFYNPWKRLISEFEIGFGLKKLFRNGYNAFKCLISPLSALVNLLVTIVEGLSNVLLGDFEQFTHLYETDQLSSNKGFDRAGMLGDSDGRRNELLRRVRTVRRSMTRI